MSGEKRRDMCLLRLRRGADVCVLVGFVKPSVVRNKGISVYDVHAADQSCRKGAVQMSDSDISTAFSVCVDWVFNVLGSEEGRQG